MSSFTAWPLSFWAPEAETRAGCSPLCLHILLLPSQLLRAFFICAWPLAALAVAFAYAKYSFWKELFLLNRMATFFPTMNSQGGQTHGWEGGRANHSSQEPLGLLVSSAHSNPGLLSSSAPTSPQVCPENYTTCDD